MTARTILVEELQQTRNRVLARLLVLGPLDFADALYLYAAMLVEEARRQGALATAVAEVRHGLTLEDAVSMGDEGDRRAVREMVALYRMGEMR